MSQAQSTTEAAGDASSALSGAANVIKNAQAIGSSDPSVLEEK